MPVTKYHRPSFRYVGKRLGWYALVLVGSLIVIWAHLG